MKVRCLRDFVDLKHNVVRKAGEVFEADKERLAELQNSRFGKLAERVGKEKK